MFKSIGFGLLGYLAFSVIGSSSVAAERLTAAVASNFTAPMKRLTQAFEQRSGHQVRLAIGSSGKLMAQITHGAPFDLFFSADQQKPRLLQQQGLASSDSRFTYASGRLVLWSSPVTGTAASEDLSAQLIARLKGGDFRRLALANPRVAPYGLAARQVLEHLNLVDSTQHRWVMGENITQAFQFVSSGNADLGLVALSQLIQEAPQGSYWLVPADIHRPIYQDVVLLKRGKSNPAADEFLRFLRSAEGRQIIEKFGYSVPTDAATGGPL